jgi:hypothetical protein
MAPTSIADALASCLSRIEAGEALSDVLADHPAHADELKALVRAAMAVRTHRPAPSPSYRASLQHHLSTLPPPDRTPLFVRPRLTARVWALRTAAAVAAGVVAFSGLAVASADSRPGDALYPIRRGVERIHDVADRVAPPIGRAIDYLTIRSVPDEPSSATPEPTAALAPGSTVIEPLDRPTRARNTVPPADDAQTGEPAATGRRSLPNPGVVVVGDAGTQPAPQTADDAAATLRAGQAETAVAGEPAEPTATARRSQTPAAAGTDTPPPAAPPVVAATAVPPGAAGGLSGIVTGQEGTGLPGAMVSVYPLREDGEPRWGARVSLRTQIDGTFVFGDLPPGRYKLAVGELAPWVWRVWYKDTLNVKQAEPITVEPGRETDGIEVRLRRNPWSFTGWGGHGRRGRR